MVVGTAGDTLCALVVRIPSHVVAAVRQAHSWSDGPLPVVFAVKDGQFERATGELRSTFYGEEVRQVLYGGGIDATAGWASRLHRFVSSDLTAEESPDCELLALELLCVEVGEAEESLDAISTSLCVLHLVVRGSMAKPAAQGDRDLLALQRLLHPERHRDEPLPAELAAAVGIAGPVLREALDNQQPWFVLVRTASDAASFPSTLRGASAGAVPQQLETALNESLSETSMDLSSKWAVDIHPRGIGFARRLWNRDEPDDFFDTAAPAYARSIYLDVLLLVRVQNDLLSELRLQMATTPLPDSGNVDEMKRVIRLQRSVSLYRIRIWWSSLGRGSFQDSWLRQMQSEYDLRPRMEDLEAESAGVNSLLASVSELEAIESRSRQLRTSQTFSALLFLVALLTVPQTLLAIASVGGKARWVWWRGWPLESWAINGGVLMVFMVLAGLLVWLGVLVALGARRPRRPRTREPD